MSYKPKDLAALLPFPAADANKYTRGKALLVAGASTYPGAACLAAMACQKTGAGYTQVLCAESSVAQVRACSPSLVVSAWEEVFVSELCESAIQSLRRSAVNGMYSERGEEELSSEGAVGSGSHYASMHEDYTSFSSLPFANAYLVGCGMPADNPAVEKLVHMVLSQAKGPVLLDAGALGAVANEQFCRVLKRRAEAGGATVFTPHEGEAARLAAPLGFQTDSAEKLAQKLASAYCATVVLKGPHTYISDGTQTYCMENGTPALAKAGTGDVLAGMCTAFLAQGLSVFDACVLATHIHALAARCAAVELTEICVCPTDVIEYVPCAIKELMN